MHQLHLTLTVHLQSRQRGFEVNLFSLYFLQIPVHDFLILGLPQPLTHSAFLTQASTYFPDPEPGLRYYRRDLGRSWWAVAQAGKCL